MSSTFEENVEFKKSKFKKYANFSISVFKRNVNFEKSIFNNVYFLYSVFNAVTSFLDISYDLLYFKKYIFESTTYFENKENDTPSFAFFNLINFKSVNSTTFVDFSLSTTSSLLTDVKDITIILDISKNAKLFDEMLLESCKNKPCINCKDENFNKYITELEKNLKIELKNNKFLSDENIEKITSNEYIEAINGYPSNKNRTLSFIILLLIFNIFNYICIYIDIIKIKNEI